MAMLRAPRAWRGCTLALAAVLLWGGFPIAAWGQFNGDFIIRQERLDRDNFLDWRSYQLPISWLLDSYARPNLMQASVGSLSPTRFFFSHLIRLEADLGAYASFLYLQQQVESFRAEPIYQEVELRAGVQPWYASIVGFPQFQKGTGSEGFAVAYGKRTDDSWLRLSQLQQFTLYNERPPDNTPDRFHPNPILSRLEGRVFLRHQLFLQVDLKDEAPTLFSAPELGLERRYDGAKADVTIAWLPRANLTVGYLWSDNTEHRRQIPDLPTPATPDLAQTLTWGWQEAYGTWRGPQGDILTLAWSEARFRNGIRSSNPADAYLFDLGSSQVYALWEKPYSNWLRWEFSFQYGQSTQLELTGGLPSSVNNGTADKFKVGAGILLVEEARYRFWFNSTWAPDAFSGQKWDGGNVQLQIFF